MPGKCWECGAPTPRQTQEYCARCNRIFDRGTKPVTTLADRERDGVKCFALEIINAAAHDYRHGACRRDFFFSKLFHDCCGVAGLLPEYVRKGIFDEA